MSGRNMITMPNDKQVAKREIRMRQKQATINSIQANIWYGILEHVLKRQIIPR